MLIYFTILFIVLTVLATCLALYERNQAEQYAQISLEAINQIEVNDEAWEKGIDDREEAWGAEIHDALDRIQLLEEVAEGYYEELVLTERSQRAYREAGVDLAVEKMALATEVERLNAVQRTVESERDSLILLITTLNKDYDELDELYGEAATELLDTINEVDKIASEVHDFMSGTGTPFD